MGTNLTGILEYRLTIWADNTRSLLSLKSEFEKVSLDNAKRANL